jgi:hypothetical protein
MSMVEMHHHADNSTCSGLWLEGHSQSALAAIFQLMHSKMQLWDIQAWSMDLTLHSTFLSSNINGYCTQMAKKWNAKSYLHSTTESCNLLLQSLTYDVICKKSCLITEHFQQTSADIQMMLHVFKYLH